MIVVIGVIRHGDKFLLGLRPLGKFFGGSWEFPGGKVENGETEQAALVRELKEELDADVAVGPLLLRADGGVMPGIELAFYSIASLITWPTRTWHDELRWVTAEDMEWLPLIDRVTMFAAIGVPLPPARRDRVVERVCADLRDRSEVGLRKYGVTLERRDLKLLDWLRHAYEETLDAANYMKRTILKLEGKFEMKNVYIASNYDSQQRIREDIAPRFEKIGVRVTSRWFTDGAGYVQGHDAQRAVAQNNVTDIEASDTLVVDVLDDDPISGRGGKHFEVGYAFARGLEIHVVGRTHNGMFFQDGIVHHESWDAFFATVLR